MAMVPFFMPRNHLVPITVMAVVVNDNVGRFASVPAVLEVEVEDMSDEGADKSFIPVILAAAEAMVVEVEVAESSPLETVRRHSYRSISQIRRV